MVVGSAVAVEEKCPLVVDDGSIGWVDHFLYLGSLISENGEFMRKLKGNCQCL